jgi:hypothetical protein
VLAHAVITANLATLLPLVEVVAQVWLLMAELQQTAMPQEQTVARAEAQVFGKHQQTLVAEAQVLTARVTKVVIRIKTATDTQAVAVAVQAELADKADYI